VLKEVIEGPHLIDHLYDVFDIMRAVGIINNDLVDMFFLSGLELLKNEPGELIRFGSRYTNMHSVFTGRYQNKTFEKKMNKLICESLSSLKEGSPRWRPDDFATRIGLLMSFDHEIDDDLFNHLENIIYQVSSKGLMSISRGIEGQQRQETGYIFRKQRQESELNVTHLQQLPRSMRSSKTEKMEQVSLLVNKATRIKLRKSNHVRDSGNDLSEMLKNLTSRSDLFEEDCFNIVVTKIIDLVDNGVVSVSTVRDISTAVNSTNMQFESPDLVNSLIKFFLARPDPEDIHTHFLAKLLAYCGRTGHNPGPEFLDLCSKCLSRDIDSLPGITILIIANSLCSFDALPQHLVNSLFSNELMSKLDKELNFCLSRHYYPKQLQKQLMYLNRGVVLQYPKFGVPWFHQKYCLENTQELIKQSQAPDFVSLREEVYEHLCTLLGGWRYVKENTYSRYFNYIDFEVHYDSRGNPVDVYTTSSALDNKPSLPSVHGGKSFAIQVLPARMWTVDTKKATGRARINSNELKLEGWQVIHINPFSWNSMQFAEDHAKRNYLQSSLLEAAVM